MGAAYFGGHCGETHTVLQDAVEEVGEGGTATTRTTIATTTAAVAAVAGGMADSSGCVVSGRVRGGTHRIPEKS